MNSSISLAGICMVSSSTPSFTIAQVRSPVADEWEPLVLPTVGELAGFGADGGMSGVVDSNIHVHCGGRNPTSRDSSNECFAIRLASGG